MPFLLSVTLNPYVKVLEPPVKAERVILAKSIANTSSYTLPLLH